MLEYPNTIYKGTLAFIVEKYSAVVCQSAVISKNKDCINYISIYVQIWNANKIYKSYYVVHCIAACPWLRTHIYVCTDTICYVAGEDKELSRA